jgi:hypothetical protein
VINGRKGGQVWCPNKKVAQLERDGDEVGSRGIDDNLKLLIEASTDQFRNCAATPANYAFSCAVCLFPVYLDKRQRGSYRVLLPRRTAGTALYTTMYSIPWFREVCLYMTD